MPRPREYIVAAIAIGVMLFLMLPARAAGRIAVNQYSEVAGDKILVGDIAALSGMAETDIKELSARSLGPAPKPDMEFKLSSSQVKTKLYNAGLDSKDFEFDIPAKIIVKRKASHVPGRQLADFTADYVQKNTVWGGGPVAVKVVKQPPDITMAYGDVTLEAVPDSRPNQYGWKNFRVDIMLNGEKERSVATSQYIEVYGDTLVAAQPISAGSFVKDEDVEIKEMPLDKLGVGTLTSADEAVGKKAKHNIAKGAPLALAVLDVQPDVNSGETVTLVMSRNGFTIITKGKALEKGFKGDLIRVIASESKKSMQGIIIDKQTVDVLPQ